MMSSSCVKALSTMCGYELLSRKKMRRKQAAVTSKNMANLYPQKLASMLQLPANIEIARAQVGLLRLTIPVDIHSSPIVTDVQDVQCHVKVLSATDLSKAQKKTLKKMKAGVKPSETDVLPSVADLAQSFLQTEASEEREELEKAIKIGRASCRERVF